MLYFRGNYNPNNRGNQMIARKELIETLTQMNDLEELRLIQSVIRDKMKSLGSAIKY